MIDYIIEQFKNNFIGFGGFILALISLLIHAQNRIIQKRVFNINRDAKRKGALEFIHISSEQLEDSFICKLVVFNPSSQGVILQSLQVFRQHKNNFPILQEFGLIRKWNKIDVIWWPSKTGIDLDIKYLEEEYENLYVKDIRIILVSINGFIDRDIYKFNLKTGHEEISRITTISGYDTQFPSNFKRYYKD